MGRKSNIRKVTRNNSDSKDIQKLVMMDLYLRGYSPITSNFTGGGLAECDILAVSKANMAYEFEVKISRGDFKKDFTKHKHWLFENDMPTKEYNAWKKGKRTGEKIVVAHLPNYFTFVTPNNLVKLEEIPAYAGLLYVSDDFSTLEWVRKPPKIHDHKIDEAMIRKLAHQLSCKFIFGGSYMNYMKQMQNSDNEEDTNTNLPAE